MSEIEILYRQFRNFEKEYRKRAEAAQFDFMRGYYSGLEDAYAVAAFALQAHFPLLKGEPE